LPHYLLRVSSLSGVNLLPAVDSVATGKAFFTLNALDGTAQAIVRVANMAPAGVVLFRANNLNSTGNGRVLYSLEAQGGYWRLPSGAMFGVNDFNDIGRGRLIVIAASENYPMGEIGGRI